MALTREDLINSRLATNAIKGRGFQSFVLSAILLRRLRVKLNAADANTAYADWAA